MKKVLLVALLAIGVSAASYAQGGFNRTPAEQAEALKTSLSLTADQTAKVTAIFAGQTKTRDSLMSAMQGGGDRAVMMTAFTKMQNDASAKIKAILTADQAKTYQKQLDERAERMKQFQQGQN